jgi:hypothetical protein
LICIINDVSQSAYVGRYSNFVAKSSSAPHPASYVMGTKFLLLGQSSRGMKLDTDITSRLRMSVSTPLLPLHVFIAQDSNNPVNKIINKMKTWI